LALSVALSRLEEESIAADPSQGARLVGELERLKTAILLRSLAAVATPAEARGTQSPNLSGDEAAAYLRMKRSRLDELRRKGLVAAMRSGKGYVYRRHDLDLLQMRLTRHGKLDDDLQLSKDNGTVSPWHEKPKETPP
jgi:hypothetical protein